MSQQKYPKAYEAYQQAVYRDGRNPTFWCSIGVLYYQINQYRDALDAYSRAIRLNPNISEVWYDLGTLVSCLSTLASAKHPLTCLSTSLAITKPPMHSTHTSVPPILILRTCISKLACSSCRTASPQAAYQTKTAHRFHRMSTLKPINPRPSMVLLALSGVRKLLLKPLRDQSRLLWAAAIGIVL